MPTIAKLMAAVAFALVAYVTATEFAVGLPPNSQLGWFFEISAGIGLLCGWFVMGKLTGKGYRVAIGSGMRTALTTAAWCLLVFSTVLMVRKAFKMRYDGPMEAVVDIFKLALENGALMLSVSVVGSLLVGGALGGLFAEWSRRRWE